MTTVPLSVPSLSGRELEYLKQCIDSNWVSSAGPFVERFETEFASFVGARHAIACASGTAALHVAMRLVGASQRDVLVSTFTFIGSVNPIVYEQGMPVFVDSETASWNADPGLIADEIERRARVSAPLPAAVEIVHIFGQPANIEPILKSCAAYGIPVIEDAAEALGASYVNTSDRDRRVGTLGQIGCFSFNGNKIITCGGGGMIVTDDPVLAARARHLTTQAREPGLEYQHDEVGYNYRLTNIAAAVGLAQLEQLPAFLEQKRRIAERYDRHLAGCSAIGLPPRIAGTQPNNWLYSITIDQAAFGASARDLIRTLRDEGIEARPLWRPVHAMPLYAGARRLGGKVAETLFANGLSLPSSVDLTHDEQDRVIEAIVACAQRV